MRLRRILTVLLPAALCLLWAGCSTTRRLAPDETLYTGVKKIAITTQDGAAQSPGLAGEVKTAVNVRPNNPLVSPYLRTPFPVGLWVYNNWHDPGHGWRHWLYDKLVAEPVLISDVRPEARVKMIDEILDNHGYFRGHADYTLVQGRNKRKASIRYNVFTGPEYRLDSIALPVDTTLLCQLIDSVARRDSYLKRGSAYNTDSLAAVRVRIANAVRDRGYYFFKPDYLIYLADSLRTPLGIDMRMELSDDTPKAALQQYRTGRITAVVNRYEGGGTPDTTVSRRLTLVQMKPSRLRKHLVQQCVTFRPGKPFEVSQMNSTQANLSRLGIFSAIDIAAWPDTAATVPTLDLYVDCTIDAPLEASLEVNATSKSNSYIGPGLVFNVTNKNLWGGGEQLNIQLTGSYEWQTGRNRGSVFNSYEFGASATLSMPRLVAPRFFKRMRRVQNWTRISVGADILNRPHYFRMAQFNALFAYDWRVNRYWSNSLTPFKLTYTKLLRTTQEFDSVMAANPAVKQSFSTTFIPQIAYSVTYDRRIDRDNSITWTTSAQEAGNIFWAAWRLAGAKGEKRLLGTPFSQFVKGQSQVVYNRRLKGENWLVGRLAVGAVHAYGNADAVPYAEQFYVGGANSIRAFTVRSLGPGSYRAPEQLRNGYFDQTGTFKLEFNVEYRFPIYGPLHGAVFFDSGNVWLLKADEQRPGGLLTARTFWNDIATGTGAGLRVDIGMLVIRGDLGVGIHAPYDTGRRGYYNMPDFKHSLAFHLAIGYPF